MRMSFTGPRFRRRRPWSRRSATASSGCARSPASCRRARHAACRSRAATDCRSGSWAVRLDNGPWLGGGAWTTVSPGYFETFKIPRHYTDAHSRTWTTPARPPVAIINESMAKQFWKTGDPLNDRLVIGRGIMQRVRRRAGPADHRRRGRQPRQRAESGSGPEDVHAAGAGARPGQSAQHAAVAGRLGDSHASVPPLSLSAAMQQQLREATGPAGVGHSLDGAGGLALDVARAIQLTADDGVRRVGARCSRRSASTA